MHIAYIRTSFFSPNSACRLRLFRRHDDLSLTRRIFRTTTFSKNSQRRVTQKWEARYSVLDRGILTRETFAMIQRGQSRNASVKNACQAIREWECKGEKNSRFPEKVRTFFRNTRQYTGERFFSVSYFFAHFTFTQFIIMKYELYLRTNKYILHTLYLI